MIPVGQISTGGNPRKYFDVSAQAELEASIRTQNLLQPILVRQLDNGYKLVAGERRLRAFTAVYGIEASIPALVRTMTDEEADAASLIENVIRSNMTPVEEAEAAAKLLGQYQGDRDETAKKLGWSRSILDRRLALMYGSDKVRAALQEQKILLGHAELLSACRKESQDAAVDHLLKQEKMLTVADLKAYLETHALLLDGAIFDKTECTGCHHNSENQSTLFAEAISTGRCTNKQCFDLKSEAEINIRAEGLKDEFQVVRIVRPGDNLTVIPLVAEGAKGVGEEQAASCKVCKDFGAVVSAVPDKMGRVFKNMCMNVPCNTKHNATMLKAEADAIKASNAPEKTHTESKPGTPSVPTVKDAAKATTPAVPKGPVSSEPSTRVKEYREKLWRKIFERAVAKLSVPDNRMVLLALCLSSPGVINTSVLGKSLETLIPSKRGAGPAALLADISSLDQAQLGGALNFIAASVNDVGNALGINEVSGILKFFDVKIESYWKVDKSFFELLTKNEIDAVCDEIGLKTAMGAEYAKVRNGSKEEYITAVMGVKDFDFRGRIPSLINYSK